MRRYGARRMAAVWMTLAALLFSALSPALAGVLFADRPDILARVLALPAQPQSPGLGDICHSEASVSAAVNPAGDADADAQHAAHGIYCSFCLAANSVITLPPVAVPPVAFALTAPEPLPAVRVQCPPFSVPRTHHSRAPPVHTLAR